MIDLASLDTCQLNACFPGFCVWKAWLCAQTVVPLHRFRITYIELKERKLIMTVLFLVTFVVAVCIAEAVKVNNDINLGIK